MRALVPDAGAAAFEVLGGVGVAAGEGVVFGVFEGEVVLGFGVLALGALAEAVGVCDAAGLGSLCSVPPKSRPRSTRPARCPAASLHQSPDLFSSAL
uniref:hypothetical protein n=1 Tax=Streptomyces asoensis TaxID=249586 RepID=UPI0034610F4F